MSEENMDANSTDESSTSVDGGSVDSSQEQATQTDGGQQQQESNLPFHEHPRFKELIESRSQLQSRVDELVNEKSRFEQEMQHLRQQMESFQRPAQSTENPLVTKLQGIDKDLAEFVKQGLASQQELAAMKAEMQAREANQYRDTVMRQLNTLHETNKVPKELQSFYQSEVMRLASENPNLRISDLDNVYKQVHDTMNKYLDNYKRDATKEYVKTKTKDSSVPASAKGGSTAASKTALGKAPDGVNQREFSRAEIVKMAIRQARGESDL